MREEHRLTNKDLVDLTGVCSVCGPVAIRARGYRGGVRVFRCAVKVYEDKENYRSRKSGMVLSQPYRDEFNTRWWQQEGRCGICKRPLKQGTGGAALDHNHTTGALRGLLCSTCNLKLGILEDENFVFLSSLYRQRYEE